MPRFALAIWLGLLAAACALQPPAGEPLSGQGAFELVGRVAVRYGAESVTGRIQWRHGPGEDELLITSPVGQGVARIQRRENGYELVTSDDKRYSAPDAEALTQAVLGWRMPLAGLPHWIRGQARAGSPAALRRDQHERLVELRQDDWRIEYQEYEGARPARLKLSRENVEIRMVIDQWRAAP